MIPTVTLNAAVDRTLVVPSLTLGHRHRAPESVTLAGGKGINVARSLRTLGVPVLATGFVGGRNGDAIRDGLSAAAIPFDLVEIEGYSRTSTAIIDPMGGTQTEINEYGPEVSPSVQEFTRRLDHLMEYATAIVFAGSLPPNLDESFFVGLVQRSGSAVSTQSSTRRRPSCAQCSRGVPRSLPRTSTRPRASLASILSRRATSFAASPAWWSSALWGRASRRPKGTRT